MRATPGKSIHYDDAVQSAKAKCPDKVHSQKGKISFANLIFLIFCPFFIVAAVCGMGVENMSEEKREKCKKDLDIIRNAINLHDAQNRPLTGTDLEPLLGRYLCSLPRDPHGNDYLLDANLGIVISYGEDGIAGGSGDDQDLKTRYKPALRIQRVQYEGPMEVPNKGSRLYITMTKPYSVADENELLRSIEILRSPFSKTGDPISLATLNEKYGHGWRRLREMPNNCKMAPSSIEDVLVFENDAIPSKDSPSFKAETSVNFTFSPQPKEGLIAFGLCEKPCENGITDETRYGEEAKKLRLRPEYIPRHGEENRGVNVEFLR